MAKIIFSLSVLTAFFWCSVMLVDIYHFAIVGAIYEILWLPMLLLIYIMPIVVFVFLLKTKFNLKSWLTYSFLLLALTIVIIWFYS